MFYREFYSETCRNFLDNDVIIVMSSVHRTRSTRVLFSPPVIYHNSSDKQHRNEKMNKLNTLMPSL